jgi:hypothetical protein
MLQLEFRADGTAELTDPDDIDADGNVALIWASDDDEEFHDKVPLDFLTEQDADSVLDYLVDAGAIDEDDAPMIEIYAEDGDGPGDDEDDEDEDDDEMQFAGDTFDSEAQHLN